jgi:hypothetical protein
MSRIVFCSKAVLQLREVERLLRSPPSNKVSSQPPVKPKAGEVYLFQGSVATAGDDNTYAFIIHTCVHNNINN